MAAAVSIAEEGLVPTVIDAQRASGGQIWRGGASTELHREFNRLVGDGRIIHRAETTVIDAVPESLVTTRGQIPWDRLILATGARELFLPFPGWTEPGVMGAGGLQAAYKSGLEVKGKRVLLAGSGPLLLAVGATLRDAGAEVVAICEQAPFSAVLTFGAFTVSSFGKVGQALSLGLKTAKVFRAGAWITKVVRADDLMVHLHGQDRPLNVDYVGVGFGLVPNLELPRLLGCDIRDGQVRVDQNLETNQSHVWCAGETTGIGGVDSAVAEGQLAARAALQLSVYEAAAKVEKWRAYEAAMRDAYKLRPEVKQLAQPETLVCRCEGVPYRDLEGTDDPMEAKLDHRVGMGWCQGRVCGAACRELFGWPEPSVRPPLFPIAAAQYANLLGDHDES
jgi:NADPH-dependent 2,4-dienoyl-CoA reductase/sulfur reductase-like enzyme